MAFAVGGRMETLCRRLLKSNGSSVVNRGGTVDVCAAIEVAALRCFLCASADRDSMAIRKNVWSERRLRGLSQSRGVMPYSDRHHKFGARRRSAFRAQLPNRQSVGLVALWTKPSSFSGLLRLCKQFIWQSRISRPDVRIVRFGDHVLNGGVRKRGVLWNIRTGAQEA